jgi:hypothetical protein
MSPSGAPDSPADTGPTPRAGAPGALRIAGRYTVEAELAVGGMGAVYRVRDESTGRVLALKRLLPDASNASAILFRKEYHTLVLLRHPRIIEVYDYGVADGRPYYTMELLDGEDLRALAPLSYRQACKYLRDVASSLALLHAHRLLHCDLTPRNVRATSDGRCKLIDFGALAPFGTPQVLVGTPPFVPPESLRGLALDQRADLFSLGALAFFLLTRTHAYPAKGLEQLESLWRSPPAAPSVRGEQRSLEPIPAELDVLVLSLLSLDPLVRPASAAEVIERLEAIAELTPDPGPWMAQSYLTSAQMVGRARELGRAKELAARSVEGAGGVMTLEHAAGAGGTRLLTEIGIEARLAGAVVFQVDGEAQRGPFAVARALAAKLFRALPEQARQAASPDIHAVGWGEAPDSDRLEMRAPPIDVSLSPGAWRVRVQSACQRWFLDVAASQPLAILVDNLQSVDEGSAALLAALAARTRHNPLLLAATLRSGELVSAPAAVKALTDAGERFVLSGLSAEDTQTLMRSLFGDVPNSERLAQWLYRISGGHPLHLTELSQYLVTHRIARYIDGTWSLPQELPPGLPSRVEEALDSRLDELTPGALALARTLSVHDGPLSLELCVALAEDEHGDAFDALDELTARGVLVGLGERYNFARGTLRERLVSRLGADERRQLHHKLGTELLAATNVDLATTLQAGWHLYHGGEEERGADILRRVGLDLVSTDELPAAIPALEAAISVYRKLGRPTHELMGLLSPVAFAGYYVDRRLADRYGDETIALFAEETGLALTQRLRPYLGSIASLLVGLTTAFGRHFFAGRGGPRALSDRIAVLGAISSALTGTATLCLDAEGAARRASVFEPFSVLGRRHAGGFAFALAQRLSELTQDRAAETIAGLRELLVQIETPGGVVGAPDRMKPIMKGGILFALGALEGFMDEPLALARADALEELGLGLYAMVACQVRANYHACRGEAALASEYEHRVEAYAMNSGSAWQAEVWAPTSRTLSFNLTSDFIGLKRTAEDLERLTPEIPSLSRYASFARASLKALRGQHAATISILEQLLEGREPRSFIGWCAVVGALAAACNQIGQHDRAAALCRDAIVRLSEADRLVVALNLNVEIQLALAEAGLGRRAEAAQRLDELLVKHAPNRGPISLGSLHHARARVAQLADDRPAFEYHLHGMERWFRSTKNPALIAQCERLAQTVRASNPPPPAGEVPDVVTVRSGPRADPWLLLAACSDSGERARRALELALERFSVSSGALFGMRDGVLAVLAEKQMPLPAHTLLQAVGQRITLAVADTQATAIRSRTDEPDPLAAHSVMALTVYHTGRDTPRSVGAFVLPPTAIPIGPDLQSFVRGIAAALYDSGDVSTMEP